MSARRRHERGLVLVVVLWGIAALSLIAAAILSSATTSVRVSRNVWSQLTVEAAADAGAQAAVLSLFDPSPSGAPLDGSERRSSFDDVDLTVSVRDQSGLIDINYAGRDLLRSYFRAQGLADGEAITLADRVIAWRSPRGLGDTIGGGADEDQDDGGYEPRRAPFQSLDELTFVRGVTPELFRRLAAGLTVYSHRPDFDTRTAPKEVLELIPGMNAAKAEAMIVQRAPVLPISGRAYLVEATAERSGVRFTRRAVYLRSGDPARPFWILDWR